MTHRLPRLWIAALAALTLAGCASADKNQTTPATGTTAKATTTMQGMAGMAGMGVSSTVGEELPAKINGVRRPVASQVLATTVWQGMQIQARTMTPATFVLVRGAGNGVKETLVKPPKDASFHLMIMLNDVHTGFAIPYAGVWASIYKNGKLVYNERQWPMLSAYMGSHYGNNVTLPGPGHYKLQLLISPPVSARHLEYRNVWLKPHSVVESFNWHPTT